ncbi:interleukin-7 isoform X3 [Falco biarmicus]|uniref:interleukin-7 isoform X2 n=1 Tax=Falco rusticolus TaxID=120794 RepID=UPI0018869E73|nr:interleukin-7 isoform X2 [Falco rusticolus]XP_055561000.1 interleukin-7 isoform X3 [Falco cherrug]XP_056187768.1 interleukin-7 isoform X3 [Falco biarmicus]
MFHAVFRSIFWVLPLLLVLSPVNSSSCAMGNKNGIRAKYENILSHDINELEIESLQSMACNMLRFFHKQKISKDFRWKAALVSCGTLQLLQCKCERLKKEKVCTQVNTQNKEDTGTSEQPKKKCNQELCELKENISSLRSCWNKFEKIFSR